MNSFGAVLNRTALNNGPVVMSKGCKASRFAYCSASSADSSTTGRVSFNSEVISCTGVPSIILNEVLRASWRRSISFTAFSNAITLSSPFRHRPPAILYDALVLSI